MTTNRRRKNDARARQRAAGVPYSLARRQVRTLAEVLDEHPTLGSFGFGVFFPRSKTPAEREHELERYRAELRRAARDVDQVRGWLLDNLKPIKTPTQSSYRLKHIAERALGRYVSNGELIAAALMAGYPISRPDGPNVNVAVSARDLVRLPIVDR
jgi:hypothetical protein